MVHYFLVRLVVSVLQFCLQLDVLLVFLVELDYEFLSLKRFSCDFRYTLGALLKYLRHTSEGCFFFILRWSSPPKQDICSARCLRFICKVFQSSAVL